MDYFRYRQGELYVEDLPIADLAERFGTPLYVYSARTLVDHFDRFAQAFASVKPNVCFAIKSCQNLAILRLLRERGAGFDVVSGGELARALEAGANPEDLVFAGVGKTDEEIIQALQAGIGWFNVESEAELDNLASLAERTGAVARAALRINPDVDPHTHVYTTTGKRETKFGVDLERARRAFDAFARRPGLQLHGLHLHIGSLVNTVDPYVDALTRALDLSTQLRRDGFTITSLNLGGGFGAHYDGDVSPPAAAYAERIVPLLRQADLRVLFEPGRCIVANAGVLVARTIYTKASGDRRFVVVDAAMTDLIRPALYGAFHFAWPVNPGERFVPPSRVSQLHMDGTVLCDLVGPVCESSDFLAKDRWLPPLQRGDLVCVFTAGAYGFAMSSQYNSRPRAAEVLVQGDDARLIRRRETYDDLVALERM